MQLSEHEGMVLGSGKKVGNKEVLYLLNSSFAITCELCRMYFGP